MEKEFIKYNKDLLKAIKTIGIDWRQDLKYKDIFSWLPMKYQWGTIGWFKKLILQYLIEKRCMMWSHTYKYVFERIIKVKWIRNNKWFISL